MSISHIENLLELVQGKQLSQFKGLTNWDKMLSLFCHFMQEAEDNIYDLVISRMLDNANDAQLDQWGAVIGELREGEADSAYRNIIKARIRANSSNGNIEDLLIILEFLTLSSGLVQSYTRLNEQFPARISMSFITFYPLSDSTRNRIKRMIELARPAGVSLFGIVECRSGYFGFDKDDDAVGFDYGVFGSLIT